jgi:O-antigen/teichoic acid export membrane protein
MNVAFARTVAWRLFATVATVVSGLSSLHLLSRAITQSEYSAVGVALVVMGYLPLLDGGFRTVLNRRLLADVGGRERHRWLTLSQTLQSWLSIVGLLLSTLAMTLYSFTPAAQGVTSPWLLSITLGAAGTLAVVSQMQANLLIGLGQQSRLFVLTGINSLANLAMLWLGFRCHFGVWAFPFSLAASSGLQFALAALLTHRMEPGLKMWRFRLDPAFWADFRECRLDAWATLRSQTAIVLLFSLDGVIVGLLSDRSQAASYVVLMRLFGIIRSCLQAASEAIWPLIAAGHEGAQKFQQPLLRLNAWTCGAAMGAVAVTLSPFLAWLMHAKWTPAPALVALFAAKFWITGMSSPAGYFLIGLGDFRTLARYVERELIAALVLSGPLGWWFGTRGVAMAFLGATVFGTMTPIFAAYARQARLPAGPLIGGVWLRGLVAMVLAATCAFGLLHILAEGWGAVVAGAGGATLALLPAWLWAKSRSTPSSGLFRQRAAEILRHV